MPKKKYDSFAAEKVYVDATFAKVYILYAISCQLRNCILVLQDHQDISLKDIHLDFLEVSVLDKKIHEKFAALKTALVKALDISTKVYQNMQRKSPTSTSLYKIRLFPTHVLSVEGGFKELAYQICLMFDFDRRLQTMSSFVDFEEQEKLFTKEIKWADFLTTVCIRIQERYQNAVDFGFPLTYKKTRLADFLWKRGICVVLKQDNGKYAVTRWFSKRYPEKATVLADLRFELKKKELSDAYIQSIRNNDAATQEYVRTAEYWHRKFTDTFQRVAHVHRHRIEQIFGARNWYLQKYFGISNAGRQEHILQEQFKIQASIHQAYETHQTKKSTSMSTADKKTIERVLNLLIEAIPHIYTYWTERCDRYLRCATDKNRSDQIHYKLDHSMHIQGKRKSVTNLFQYPFMNFLIFPQLEKNANTTSRKPSAKTQKTLCSNVGRPTKRLAETKEFLCFVETLLGAFEIEKWKKPIEVSSPPTCEQQFVRSLVLEAGKLDEFKNHVQKNILMGRLQNLFQMWFGWDILNEPVPMPLILSFLRKVCKDYSGVDLRPDKKKELAVEEAYCAIPFGSQEIGMKYPLNSIERFKSNPPDDFVSVDATVQMQMMYGDVGVQMVGVVDFVLASSLPYFRQQIPVCDDRFPNKADNNMSNSFGKDSDTRMFSLLSNGFSRGIGGFLDGWKKPYNHQKVFLPEYAVQKCVVTVHTHKSVVESISALVSKFQKHCAQMGGSSSLLVAFFHSTRKEEKKIALDPNKDDAIHTGKLHLQSRSRKQHRVDLDSKDIVTTGRCPWNKGALTTVYAKQNLPQQTRLPLKIVKCMQTARKGQQGNCIWIKNYGILTRPVLKQNEILLEK